ncbi:MAG: hypothetical protein EZS28_034399 [Streblomastix strix]|uniref:Uncharacterized protein n=1 Tax=Streblomastix strix TaxID=222440 RepID=A0A5J4UIR2_9EUKA|nr:MAG: hypothetical protein EZS28_034399 [Streblomastix strix]
MVGARTGIRSMGWPFSKISKNSVKSEPPEPGLFVNFDTPKFTAQTSVTIINEQPEMGDEIWKFLQSKQQPMLQVIE